MISSKALYVYSIKIGLAYLKNCKGMILTEGIKRLIIPMDIFRYFELPLTINEISPKKGEKILDLSSPKLTSLFIAENGKSLPKKELIIGNLSQQIILLVTFNLEGLMMFSNNVFLS